MLNKFNRGREKFETARDKIKSNRTDKSHGHCDSKSYKNPCKTC